MRATMTTSPLSPAGFRSRRGWTGGSHERRPVIGRAPRGPRPGATARRGARRRHRRLLGGRGASIVSGCAAPCAAPGLRGKSTTSGKTDGRVSSCAGMPTATRPSPRSSWASTYTSTRGHEHCWPSCVGGQRASDRPTSPKSRGGSRRHIGRAAAPGSARSRPPTGWRPGPVPADSPPELPRDVTFRRAADRRRLLGVSCGDVDPQGAPASFGNLVDASRRCAKQVPTSTSALRTARSLGTGRGRDVPGHSDRGHRHRLHGRNRGRSRAPISARDEGIPGRRRAANAPGPVCPPIRRGDT